MHAIRVIVLNELGELICLFELECRLAVRPEVTEERHSGCKQKRTRVEIVCCVCVVHRFICIGEQAGLKEVSIEDSNFTTCLHTNIIHISLVNINIIHYYLYLQSHHDPMPKIIESDDIPGIQRLIHRLSAAEGISIYGLAERSGLHPTTLYAILKKRPSATRPHHHCGPPSRSKVTRSRP